MSIFAAAPDIMSGVAADSTGFAEFPGEKPDKPSMKAWVEAFTEAANRTGFGFIMRGSVPVELVKLAPRELIPVPADAALASAVNAKNLEIEHANHLNALDYDAKLIEVHNRFASRLQTAMKRTAPMRLEALQCNNVMKDGSGDVVKGSYHGGNMWEELVALLSEPCEDAVMKKNLKVVEYLRDNRVDDNCSPDQWSVRMIKFNTANRLGLGSAASTGGASTCNVRPWHLMKVGRVPMDRSQVVDGRTAKSSRRTANWSPW